MCRLGAVKLSLLRPTLEANNINMVAIGLEDLGAREFLDGGFFSGEVYVDAKKQTYQALGFRRFNWITIWKALLSRISRLAVGEAHDQNIGGNYRGDGLQNGGLVIVGAGGARVLLYHREETPGDHVSNDIILRSLGLSQMVSSDYTPREKAQPQASSLSTTQEEPESSSEQ